MQTHVLSGQAGSFHGEVMGAYNGTLIRWHSEETKARTAYGQQYQCVEFANRFLTQSMGHRNLQKNGHADSYWYQAKAKDLIPHPNGSPYPPQVNDLLIFDPEGEDDDPGHVAVITTVSKNSVCYAQQNTYIWHDCRSLSQKDGGWYVDPINHKLSTVGWATRRR